jgi:hypothetical protein
VAAPTVQPLKAEAHEKDKMEYEFELAVPMAHDGVVPVSLEVGPFTITELRVRNMPSDEEVQDPSKKDDNSHPKPCFTARSQAPWDADFKAKFTLEDDQGNVLMSCNRSKGLSRGETEELSLCWLASMKTHDWPKVKVLRLAGRVRKD